ncbi:MAG: ABC transporter substrate-binding protein [Sedimentisphaerales bacterium]|nr:ABC transporter substrate-binding protein [Sedimentisphaerales bacterium]
MKNRLNILVFVLLLAAGLLLSVVFSRITLPGASRPAGQNSGGQVAIPQRIVCMSPSITEIVFALGSEDRVVGVSNFCHYPPEAKQKPKLGGFLNPNFEQLIALEPDMVIVQGVSEKITQFCQQEDIELLKVRVDSVENICKDIEVLGRKLGCPERGKQLSFEISGALDDIKKRLAKCKPRKVFFSLYRTTGSMSGLTTIGADTFVSELISFCGGENIFNDVAIRYPQISKESLLKRAPQIIIEPIAPENLSLQYREQVIGDWRDFFAGVSDEELRIYLPTSEVLLIPGPRIVEAAAMLAKMIHPEVFGEIRFAPADDPKGQSEVPGEL